MVSIEDIESFLVRVEADFQEIEEGLWLVHPPGGAEQGRLGIVLNHQSPVLVFRTGVCDVPGDEQDQLALFQRLLEWNAADLMYGAYGLENGEIILSDTLELENLDFSEFRASLESLALALASHWRGPAGEPS